MFANKDIPPPHPHPTLPPSRPPSTASAWADYALATICPHFRNVSHDHPKHHFLKYSKQDSFVNIMFLNSIVAQLSVVNWKPWLKYFDFHYIVYSLALWQCLCEYLKPWLSESRIAVFQGPDFSVALQLQLSAIPHSSLWQQLRQTGPRIRLV